MAHHGRVCDLPLRRSECSCCWVLPSCLSPLEVRNSECGTWRQASTLESFVSLTSTTRRGCDATNIPAAAIAKCSRVRLCLCAGPSYGDQVKAQALLDSTFHTELQPSIGDQWPLRGISKHAPGAGAVRRRLVTVMTAGFPAVMLI